jgi:hypothetical protein
MEESGSSKNIPARAGRNVLLPLVPLRPSAGWLDLPQCRGAEEGFRRRFWLAIHQGFSQSCLALRWRKHSLPASGPEGAQLAPELLPEAYEESEQLVAARLAGETLQATALVDEAWLRAADRCGHVCQSHNEQQNHR